MSEIPCYMKYGGDYGMPETRSVLLWDPPRNQLAFWQGFGEGEGIFGWQQNLYLLLDKGSNGP